MHLLTNLLKIYTGAATVIETKKESNYKESRVTRRAISSGTEFCQTWSSEPDLEDLAKKWATELPRHFTWKKLQKENTPDN